MAKYYAQVDEGGVCFAVGEHHGELAGANVIEIDGMDGGLIGRRWDAEAGAWGARDDEPRETTAGHEADGAATTEDGTADGGVS